MRSDLLNQPVYKFTGKIEHWVTTFYHGFWGLPGNKEKLWRGISEEDTFLFHGTYPADYIDDNKAGGGVIGLGVVGGFDTKNEDIWVEELRGGRKYPYLIYFKEMYWFGDTDNIRLAPVSEKDESEIIDDSRALSENILKIPEMKEKTGEQISPMGLMGEVKQIDALRPVLETRLRDLEVDERDTPSAEHASETDGEYMTCPPRRTGGSELSTGIRRERGSESSTGSGQGNRGRSPSGARRDRGDADNLEVTGGEQEVSFVRDTEDIQEKNREHERSLDVVEDVLAANGFSVEETDYSDLIATRDDTNLLAEAKYIHEDNEREQIRYAIGQLFEYRYRDFRQTDLDDDPLRFLVLSQRPTDGYARFLKDLQDDGIYTVWVDDTKIKGLPRSASVFSDLL